MSRDLLLTKLASAANRQTRAEQMLANYFEAHIDDLPFETAASIAKKMQVSSVTVGRFIRRLGYRKLSELTQDLRGWVPNSAWQLKDQAGIDGTSIQSRQLKAHVENLSRVFALAATPNWRKTVKLIAEAPAVFVAAFQNGRGIGQYFSAQLDYARPGVRFLDGQDGTFLDLFDTDQPRKSCLVLIDSRRYARKAKLLAERAKAVGIKVVTITDIYCPWRDGADLALTDPGEGEVFWDSAVSTIALLELLLEAVIETLGERVPRRIKGLTELQDYFGDFSDA